MGHVINANRDASGTKKDRETVKVKEHQVEQILMKKGNATAARDGSLAQFDDM